MQRMLARVFVDPTAPWILKGGTSLLVRIPGARHSQDLDLLHPHADLEQAYNELRDLVAAPSPLDRLTFKLEVKKRNVNEGGTSVWQLKATPFLGVNGLQHFPIDLTAGKQLIGHIDRITPAPTIDIEDVQPPPEFACYPLIDQIADKLAAMYEYHGEERAPSTRWRDLADLLLIISTSRFDAAALHMALNHQRQHRAALALPSAIHLPGPLWEHSYPAIARTIHRLPPELHHTGAALAYLGQCMNPILNGTITAGTWNHTDQTWTLEVA
ncbi:nucleotidyl transferase AbiEii/AbiGii toxin family protein [Nocardia cyriacigeorgica]|uniref:nucleotidyl transferase AbiEii/AbiGii toxin family protein n=1 Tax=Nocardia cyriacigeorgica TaxID=135487 RepID=UPI001893610D|nr:nucleotidyl transferase AbiEii/AbiGii toxin family protein [Nocardia cyriacigeorgica]MBF6102181.1 nucleotidyl transferase AbiEii/AbiGii toxin family protein [Nocardia cyriacigeorgica]